MNNRINIKYSFSNKIKVFAAACYQENQNFVNWKPLNKLGRRWSWKVV